MRVMRFFRSELWTSVDDVEPVSDGGDEVVVAFDVVVIGSCAFTSKQIV